MINLSFPRLRPVMRLVLPLAATVLFGFLLWQRLAEMDMGAVRAAVAQVTWAQWALAAIATWISFQAIGRYDSVWHRVMQTGVAPVVAKRAGMRAIAIAQIVGFGAVTASLVRWRCLPGLSLWQATKLSVAVTVTFTACWAVIALVAAWRLDVALPAIAVAGWQWVALGIVLCAALGFAWRKFAPDLTTRDLAALMFWTMTDLGFAAAALFILLPAGTPLDPAVVVAAYVLALGVGLVSNAPGGAGAFDLALLTLLPMSGQEPLVAAIIAFRIVYYLIPAVLALGALMRPVQTATPCNESPSAWGLTRQSGELRSLGGKPWMLGELPFVTTAIFPIWRRADGVTDLRPLRLHAARRGKTPALYNCDPRLAESARKAGWFVRRVAMEAIIRPATWTTAGSSRQTLRRKLRMAEAAGITISQPQGALPLGCMSRVARLWAVSHGGQLGFSMGRYCPRTIAQQQVFLIRRDGRIIGFVTFHATQDDWCLDLIRHEDALPDGAIYAAIVAAIDSARAAGVSRLSLSTTPDPRYTPAFWAGRKAGLIQFKRSFGPAWVPRYHAAPSWFSFWASGVIIGIAIHRPLANLPWKCAMLTKNLRDLWQRRRLAIELARKV